MFRRMYSFSFSMNSCCFSKARVAVEHALGLLAAVGRVAAGVGGQPAVLEVDDLLGDAVEEPPVVRDDEVGPARAREVVLQELDGVEVEMVRGLVEQQHVRARRGSPAPASRGSSGRPRAPRAAAGSRPCRTRGPRAPSRPRPPCRSRPRSRTGARARRTGRAPRANLSPSAIACSSRRISASISVEVLEGPGGEVVERLGEVRRRAPARRSSMRIAVRPHELARRPAPRGPRAMRRSVVLPAPLRPTSPTFWPGLCCQVTSLSTSLGP